MKPIEEIISKVETTARQEFSFIETQHIGSITLLEEQLDSAVVVSNILFLRIQQLERVINSDGKRAAAKVFRLYREVAQTFAKQTKAYFEIHSSNSFMLVYPGPREEARRVVKYAMQLTYILTESLKAYADEFKQTDFTIGIDHGRILATNEGRLIWQGICIEKAAKISELCAKPLRIGISGMVYSVLEESDKVITRRILGIPQKEEIWTRNSYDFVGSHKHYYTTRHTEAYEPQS